MKKLISVVLCAVMLVSLLPSVFAADYELEELVKLAKSALSVTDEYTEFESWKEERQGESSYSFMWTTPEEDKSIYCDIFSDGVIHTYEMRRDREDDGFSAAALKKEEYAKIAEKWIKKVCPEYAKELNFDGEVMIYAHYDEVYVTFVREIAGVEVMENEVRIYIDKSTGEVTSMHSSWKTSEKVEDKEGIITEKEASEKLFTLEEMNLRYKRVPGEDRAILVYQPKERGVMISARDGERFKVRYNDDKFGSMNEDMAADAPTAGGSPELSRAEITAIEELNALLTKEEISGIIKKLAGTYVARYDIQSLYYNKVEYDDESYIYEAVVMLKGNEDTYGEVVLNAETGELISLYSYDRSEYDKKGSASEEDMRRDAERFAKTWASDEYEKTELSEHSGNGSYVFTERVNGIEYAENSIRISASTKTGKITSFGKYWDDDVVFDEADGFITAEEAWEKHVEEAELNLCYAATGIVGYYGRSAEELCLIYKLGESEPIYIDAKSGEALDWDTKPVEKEEEYVLQPDLKGHFAESAVSTLANSGIILTKEETFRPNEAITRQEMAYLVLVFERGYFEPTEENLERAVREAIDRGIVTNDKPFNIKASREEAASAVVSLLGYKSASKIEGIYKTAFSDEAQIGQEFLGGVAIASGLGIVRGDGNGTFAPKRNLTRGELAVMLCNAYGKPHSR